MSAESDSATLQRFHELLAAGKLFDSSYWSPSGIDLSAWCRLGFCQRGAQYRDLGTVTDGAVNQRRSISSGRKARGMASDDYKGPAE